MENFDWEKEFQLVIDFLDNIDLLSEMKLEEENIYDFMDRLEEKYPYKTSVAFSLFDCFSMSDFEDYLHKRYKGQNVNIVERSYTYVQRWEYR